MIGKNYFKEIDNDYKNDNNYKYKKHKDCKYIIYNSSIKDYECWECFKEKFKENNYDSDISNNNNKF